jgi:hypothetical protein
LRAGEATRRHVYTDEERERKRQTAIRLGLKPPGACPNGRPWTAREVALLGKIKDDRELATIIGRTVRAVRRKRWGVRRGEYG